MNKTEQKKDIVSKGLENLNEDVQRIEKFLLK